MLSLSLLSYSLFVFSVGNAREETLVCNKFEKYIGNGLFQQLETLISKALERFMKIPIEDMDVDTLCHGFSSTSVHFAQNTIMILELAISSIIINRLHDNTKLNYFIKKDNEYILPYTDIMSHRIAYKIGFSRNFSESIKDVFLWLSTDFLKDFTITQANCYCLSDRLECCCIKPTTNFFPCIDGLDGNKYNINSVPHFLNDISENYAVRHPPEVAIHNKSSNDFLTVDPFGYELDEKEQTFFQVSGKGKTTSKFVKFLLEGFCISSLRKERESYVMTFYTDRIFHSCLGVRDIRYLWIQDKLFRDSLLERLVSFQIV